MADDSPTDTKQCPLCGEFIKSVAVRCKHCHADLSALSPASATVAGSSAAGAAVPRADFDRGASGKVAASLSSEEFEQRFLDFAYDTHETLTAISVAHALKIPISVADDRLEALAAAEVILREVDDEAGVYYALPGRKRGALAVMPGAQLSSHPVVHADGSITIGTAPPTEAAAVTGLILNLCVPGVGSIVAGKPGPGVAQLAMLVAGIPLCFVLIGFPLVFASWLWAIMTSAAALQEARRADVRSSRE